MGSGDVYKRQGDATCDEVIDVTDSAARGEAEISAIQLAQEAFKCPAGETLYAIRKAEKCLPR